MLKKDTRFLRFSHGYVTLLGGWQLNSERIQKAMKRRAEELEGEEHLRKPANKYDVDLKYRRQAATLRMTTLFSLGMALIKSLSLPSQNISKNSAARTLKIILSPAT